MTQDQIKELEASGEMEKNAFLQTHSYVRLQTLVQILGLIFRQPKETPAQ